MASKKITPSLVDKVLDAMSRGIPLRETLRNEKIAPSSWYAFVNEHDDDHEIHGRIARAREAGHDWIAEECLEIADDGSNDYMTRTAPNGQQYEVLDSEHVQRSKLRIETRLKLLAKWNPKKFGDTTKIANADGSNLKIGEHTEAVVQGQANVEAIYARIKEKEARYKNADEV